MAFSFSLQDRFAHNNSEKLAMESSFLATYNFLHLPNAPVALLVIYLIELYCKYYGFTEIIYNNDEPMPLIYVYIRECFISYCRSSFFFNLKFQNNFPFNLKFIKNKEMKNWHSCVHLIFVSPSRRIYITKLPGDVHIIKFHYISAQKRNTLKQEFLFCHSI